MATPARSHRRHRYRAVLLLGPPGSGKGTQGAILGQVPGHCFVSMGDVLREAASQPAADPEIRRIMDRGDLLPAELAIAALLRHLEGLLGSRFDPEEDWLVLDGVPRDTEQARVLQQRIDVQRLIQLVAEDDDPLVQRIRRRGEQDGRRDDLDEQVTRQRFKTYRQRTLPLLERYPADRICRVDALQSPLRVLRDVVAALLDASQVAEESN